MSQLDQSNLKRYTDRFQAIVQIVLVLLILVAVNYIGMRTYQRIDMTESNLYSLSPETKAYLAQLQQPIEVYVTISEESKVATSDQMATQIDVYKDVTNLLREYEYATRNQGENSITVENLNIYSETSRAKKLGIESPEVIVFKSGDRKRLVSISELYRVRDSEMREFIGENVFTRSILEIVETSEPTLYFTSGHGELSASDVSAATGASALFNQLKARNFEAKSIDLSNVESVPEDAALVVIAAPQTRFLPQEKLLLENYLNKRAGRVLAFLETGQEHGLEELFLDWGILSEDTLVVEPDPNYIINGGDLMIRRFSQHPVTLSLYEQGIPVITDRASSVREDPWRPVDDSLIVTELLATSDKSWADHNYRNISRPTFDDTLDLAGPITIGAIAERQVDSSLGITLPGGKLTVFGTSNFISNQRIQASGNLYLALNAINYSVDRHTRLNIPPRPIEKVKLDLSIEQLHLARYLIWFGPPAIIGLFGLLVYLTRRN
ncbi:GldG family protein [Pelagicoccus albus]|uniref:GldG family protein n=1 Tax=Pelagicoccus albus TaxID=415222 RepID=A0A7X1B940_9BACT|nr:GldG family protein [Pelagicoccus albus]MBC2606658.1 GldG family protein [Pelagicoccus albus]